MIISRQNGDIKFDNAIISSDVSASELLYLPNVKTELWSSNAGYNTYRIGSLKIGSQAYTAIVVFLDARVERVTFGPKTDVSSWDEVTDASIQRDGEILKEFMKAEFGNSEKEHSFSWGKVELWQDAKNAFEYNVTVSWYGRHRTDSVLA